jgi:hypothetical protein
MRALVLAGLSASTTSAEEFPKGSVSLAVPETPAFTFLGASPAKVSQPGTARDLAIQTVNAFDEEGHVRQGFALDVRPALLRPIPLESYRQYWPRLLYNAQLSAGTVQSPGDSGSTDIALGLRLTLLDRSDPMLDGAYVKELGDAIDACKPSQPGTSTAKADLACLAEHSKKTREKWVRDHWNAGRLSVAFAAGWRAPGSVLSDATANGWSTWVSGCVPLGAAASWSDRSSTSTRPEDTVPKGAAPKELRFGGRAFVGNGRVNGFVEVVGAKRYDLPADSDADPNSWSGGVEFRVADGTFISTGFGKSFGGSSLPGKVAILANLRFALSDESRIKATLP